MDSKDKKIYFSRWALSLKQYLRDTGDERQNDVEFINGRCDLAAVEYETATREGHTVDQAMERAHHVLMEGL